MAGLHKSDKILVGKEEISAFAGFGKNAFSWFIEQGLPAKLTNGKWMAHADLINDWMKLYLRPIRGQRDDGGN
jgi:hypothetical protein